MSRRRFGRSLRRAFYVIAVWGASFAAVFVLLACANASEVGNGIKALLLSGFSSQAGLSKTLLYWPVILLAALAAGCSWQVGFLNLAVPGQMMLGAAAAMCGALVWRLPWWACLMLAAFGGALSGFTLSLIKTGVRIKPILCAVMFDFFALFLTQWLWEDVLNAAKDNAIALPTVFLGNGPEISLGVLIALLICLALWIMLRFTVTGYEIKAISSNRIAAKRAGMPTESIGKTVIVLSGALSGLAGGICILSGKAESAVVTGLSMEMGAAGLAAALLCFGHPAGIAVAAFCLAGISSGSEALPSAYPREILFVLLALMLLGSAILHRNKDLHF